MNLIPLYILDALINSINKKINEINWKPDLIIASYHGIPKKYFDKGDPYHCYCHKTTRLISKNLILLKLKLLFSQDLVHKNGFNRTQTKL